MGQKILVFVGMWACLVLVFASHGHASSVRRVTLDEMLLQCEFVFEGRVLALEARENNWKRIHTYVTFEIQDIIKGEYPSDIITLSFLGGTVGDVTMAVGDMKYPRVGERGIYFVESLEKSQVHPLYGWSQGHFLVQPDEKGTDRVMTSSEQPVTRVTEGVPAEEMNSGQESVLLLSNGVAHGVGFASKKSNDQGLTPEEFKRILQKKLEPGQ